MREMKKTRQMAVGFLIVASLFVSSVSACICSHHAEKAEVQAASCHEHSEAKQETPQVEQIEKFDSGEDCGCAAPAPRVFSKSEKLKIEKQLAAVSFAPLEIKTPATNSAVLSVYFEKPFYLSDSFYNLKSPRAPPAASSKNQSQI
jgi:hypothetical protein